MIQLKQIFDANNFDYKTQLHQRIVAAKSYFTPLLKQFSLKILNQIEIIKAEQKTKTYVNELLELDAAFYKQIQIISKTELLLNAAINNIEFKKENINTLAENKERIEQLNKPKAYTIKKKEKTAATNTPNTKETSYTLYKQGNSVEQIAQQRAMATSTIQSHLCHYVGLGLLNVTDFVTSNKIEAIIFTATTLDSTMFAVIKQTLGEEYSYAEIKFALAYYQNANKESIHNKIKI